MNLDPNTIPHLKMRDATSSATTSAPGPAADLAKPVRILTQAQRNRLFWKAMLVDLRQRFPLLVGLFVCCVASYFLASRYMVCTVVIRGRSMTPTLRDGDQYLLNRIAYLFRAPNRGDLVVIHDPGHSDMAIKRIVGLPGDRVEVRNGSLYVNDVLLKEPYLAPHTVTLPGAATRGEVKLGDRHYFVLGDNRPESEDSRFYGPIHLQHIVGVVSL